MGDVFKAQQRSFINHVNSLHMTPPRNPHYHKLLDKIRTLHDKKSYDYANVNVFSNFEFAAQTAKCSVDQAFLVLIGVKIARLHELVLSGKTPNNETVMDTYEDLTNYCAIWTSYKMKLAEEALDGSKVRPRVRKSVRKGHARRRGTGRTRGNSR